MKYLIFLFLPLCVNAQFDIKKDLPSLTTIFISGMADGLNQTISYHYNDFKRMFPNANDYYWNPNISWENKYKNHNPADGPAFFGSTGPFVFVTDGYHLSRFIEHSTMAATIILRINLYSKQKWYIYLAKAAEYLVVNRLGFCMVYNGIQIK
jgi:hypothetical protein